MISVMIDIRPHERRAVLTTFLTLFGILAGHTILETARDAFFLSHLPVHHLPWVYLVTAILAWVVILTSRGNPGRRGLVLWLWLSSGITMAFYFLTEQPRAWVFYALYVWSGFFISVAIGTFWLMLGRLFSLDQAKRLFSLIAAGSVLGAITGAGFAAYVATHLEVRDMILAAACFFALTATGPLMVKRTGLHWTTRPAEIKSLEAIRVVLDHPYLSRMAVLAIVSTITFTLVDYIFKAEVARTVAPEDLATFFAMFYAIVNLVALAVQLLLTGPALQVLGVQRTLWILPILLVFGSAFVVIGLGLVAAMALKSAEGSLKHTLHRTANEVLYLPVTEALRPYAKRLIDIFGQRVAQAIASLIILALVALGGGAGTLSVVVVLLGCWWIALARGLRPHYLEIFRATLRSGTTQTQVRMPRIDLEALEALMESLNSGDDNEVLTALDILANSNRARLIPALILHHPSPTVVLRALDIFTSARREDFVPIMDRLIHHPHPDVRAAVIRTKPSDTYVRAALADPEPLVRGTALVGLLERTDALGQEAQDLVRDLVTQGDAHARVALAQAIEHQESFKAPFEQVLTNLACHPEPAVMASAARAMAVFPRASFIHPLIAMLTFREPRNPARSALAAIGKDCVDALTGALVDDSVDFGIRVNVPHTLSVWPNEEVAERLAGHLLAEESGMIRLKILRALWRMRQINPSLTLNLNALRDSMERAIESAYVALDWVWTLKEGGEEVEGRRTVGHELLTTLIQDKYEHALDRVFRHLDLIYEDEDFARIHRGLKSTDRGHVASSLELLENLLSSPLREAVLGLVEPTSPSEDRRERLKHRFPRYTPIQETYEELLARILDSDSDSLRAVTAYHVGELKLPNFKHQLESLDFDDGSSAKEVVEHALAKLGEGAEGGAA